MAFFTGVGIVLMQGDKYILVQEVRHQKAGFFNLPAGTLEVGEDFIECILREAREETGAEIVLQHFLGVYQTVIATGNNVVFLVFAGEVAHNAVFQSDEHEIITPLAYEEVVALDKAGKLRSPIVMRAIKDFRAGRVYSLEAVQVWHVDSLDSITVGKDH